MNNKVPIMFVGDETETRLGSRTPQRMLAYALHNGHSNAATLKPAERSSITPVFLDGQTSSDDRAHALRQLRQALHNNELTRAAVLLERILDVAANSAEVHTLAGILRERSGQYHAAYRSYKAALELDPTYCPAQDNMRRYCKQFGLDEHNIAINPSANNK